jgi:hypothetical protein
MVRAVAQHEIPDSAAWTIIDAFLKDPGEIRRRGPLSSFYATTAAAIGLAGTVAPDGTWSGLLYRRSTTPSGRFSGFKNSTVDDSAPNTPSVSPYELFCSQDALNGGAMIGSASALGPSPSQQMLAYWRGATKGTGSATTLATSITRGDTTVTLAAGGGANFCSGHWLHTTASGTLIGLVKSVSGDVLTLQKKALVTVDKAVDTVQGRMSRGIYPRVSKGRITTATTSPTVNGGETRFKAQGLATGTWDVYKTDYTYIGTVSSVASDTQLALTSNAAVDLLNADYIAIRRDANSYSRSAHLVGWLNASYANHQFYADGNVLAFSDLTDPEAVFIGPDDDDTITFSDDPISALVPTTSGLVVTSEKEAFVLAGAVGTTPDRWRGDRIADDGCVSTMSAVQYKGGAIWAGRRGIWYWNGADPQNIAGALGSAYQKFMAGFDSSTYRAWGMVHNDHYFLHVENGASGIFAWYDENNTANYLTRLTFAINLLTGAVSILRNVGIRGAVTPPPSMGDGETYFAVTTSSQAVVVKASSLFGTTGNDSVTCTGDSAGPEVFVETKKYDLGDAQRLKRFKLLLLHYLVDGTVNDQASIDAGTADHIRFASVKGLNDDGVVSNTKLFVKVTPDNGDWQDKRVKFMSVSQFLAFRIWEGTDTITNLVLGAWALGFKLKRPGQV